MPFLSLIKPRNTLKQNVILPKENFGMITLAWKTRTGFIKFARYIFSLVLPNIYLEGSELLIIKVTTCMFFVVFS